MGPALYYDPLLQRFVTSDPIGIEGGLNAYAYVENSPLNFIDPEGLLLSVLHANQRGTSLDEAAEVGEMGNAAAKVGGVAGAIGAAAIAGGAGGRTAACVVKKVPEACKIPLLAAALGASICGNYAENAGQTPTGKPPGSARSYPRDRERIDDVRQATQNTLRRNTGSALDK